MTRLAVVVVAVGLAQAVVLGYVFGFDATAIAMFFALVVLGALSIAVARGKERGAARPRQCPACGGLLSSHAPYCKHCGATQHINAET